MASKMEEIGMLEKFRAEVEKLGDSYLDSLISQDMVEWFAGQVRGDLDTDAMSYIRGYCVLQSENSAMRARVADSQALADEQIEELKSALAETRDEATRWEERARDIERDSRHAAQVLEYKVDAYAETIEALEQQVVTLKAKLYDLMVK